MGHIDDNEARDNSEPIKYTLDLDSQDESAPFDTKQIPELDIVKRLREDAIKSVSQSFSQIGAFTLTPSYKAMTEIAKTLSESSQRALEATAPTIKLIPDLAKLNEVAPQTTAPLMKVMEQIQKHTFSNLALPIPSEVIPPNLLSNLARGITASLPNFNLSAFVLESFQKVSLGISESIASVFKTVGSLEKVISPFYKYFRRQYELVMAAAEGDPEAAKTLARWWFLSRNLYILIQRLKGCNLSDYEIQADFVNYVKLKCFQYNPSEKAKRCHWLKIYPYARMYCTSQLYKELRKSFREQLIISMREEQYHLIPTFEHEGVQYIFVWVAATIAARSDQAVRDMIRKGVIPAIKHDYQTRYRKNNDFAYLIPWSEEMLVQLLEIAHPDVAVSRRGLISARDVCDNTHISDRTLWRWEDEQFVVPIRLSGNKRYYSGADFKKILRRLANSASPRLQSRKPEFEILIAKYST